eukprot:Awhi_evm2s3702
MDKLDNDQTLEECIVDIFNSERQITIFSKTMTDVEKARCENGESVLAFLQRLKELFLRLSEDVRETPFVRNLVNNKIKANLPGYLKRDFDDRFHEKENISPTIVLDVVYNNNNNNNRNNVICFNCRRYGHVARDCRNGNNNTNNNQNNKNNYNNNNNNGNNNYNNNRNNNNYNGNRNDNYNNRYNNSRGNNNNGNNNNNNNNFVCFNCGKPGHTARNCNNNSNYNNNNNHNSNYNNGNNNNNNGNNSGSNNNGNNNHNGRTYSNNKKKMEMIIITIMEMAVIDCWKKI